jgi:putative oxidoreductase
MSVSQLRKSLSADAPAAVVLVRLMVGTVFFFEGVQKFLYPAALGAGRFEKIGIPAPQVMGPFVGGVEIVCGLLVLAGLLTRLAAIPLLINISVAILSTKLPILLGHGFWTFTLAKLPRYGFLSMMHEARTDFSMLLGLVFLLLAGAGAWSADAWLTRRSTGTGTPGQSPP